METTPYGKEWEAEISKLPKEELIKMIRKIQTGSEDKKICAIETINDAQNIVEGILNDYESGICTKQETLKAFGEYTARLMELFWKNAKAKFKENPQLINE